MCRHLQFHCGSGSLHIRYTTTQYTTTRYFIPLGWVRLIRGNVRLYAPLPRSLPPPFQSIQRSLTLWHMPVLKTDPLDAPSPLQRQFSPVERSRSPFDPGIGAFKRLAVYRAGPGIGRLAGASGTMVLTRYLPAHYPRDLPGGRRSARAQYNQCRCGTPALDSTIGVERSAESPGEGAAAVGA